MLAKHIIALNTNQINHISIESMTNIAETYELHICCSGLHRSLSIRILAHNGKENNKRNHRIHNGERTVRE